MERGDKLGRTTWAEASARAGHLYEAHHSETGAPAIILMPSWKDEWGSCECWQVRAMVHDAPYGSLLREESVFVQVVSEEALCPI